MIEYAAQQVTVVPEARQVVIDFVQLGFAVGVAWYLMVKTTTAVTALRDETHALRMTIEHALAEGKDDAKELKADIRTIAQAVRNSP
jgi:hypothetical protein